MQCAVGIGSVFLCLPVWYSFSTCFIVTIDPSHLVNEVVTTYWLQAHAERQLKEVSVCVCVWGCVLVRVCMWQDI